MIARGLALLAVGAVVLGARPSARAHGSAPVATDVQRLGEDLIVATTYGLVTVSPGRAPALLCHDVLGSGAKWFGAGADGALGVAYADGFSISSDRCTFSETVRPAGAVARLETGDQGVLFLVIEGNGSETLLRSRDGGRSFESVVLPSGFRAGSIKPDGRRAGRWISAGRTTSGSAVIESADDGTTWNVVLERPGDDRFRVLSAGPSGFSLGTLGATAPGILRISTDGTATFESLPEHPIFITETSPGIVWAGLPREVRRSALGGAPGSWAPVPEVGAWTCLRALDGALFACPASDVDRVAVRVSSDQGASWAPFLKFNEIAGPNECPAGTTVHDMCAAQWPVDALAFGIGPAPTAPAEEAPDGCGCGFSESGALVALSLAKRRRARTTVRQPEGGPGS